MKIKVVLMSLLALGLGGCTISSPVTTVGKYEGLNTTDPAKGTVFVYREDSFVGVANQYDVMVNNELVGSLPNGSFFSVDITPGEARIEPRTLTAFGLGNGTDLTVEQGQSYCLKLTLNFCVQCKSADISVVDRSQCTNEINKLKKVQLD